MSKPTHVWVGSSPNGEEPTNGYWMRLEDFAELFTHGVKQTKDERGQWGKRNVVTVRDDA